MTLNFKLDDDENFIDMTDKQLVEEKLSSFLAGGILTGFATTVIWLATYFIWFYEPWCLPWTKTITKF